MKLIPDWKAVLGGAWSVWLMALAALVSIADLLLRDAPDALPWLPTGWLPLVSATLATLAIPARIVLQTNMSQWLARFWRDQSGAVRARTAAGLGAAAVVIALATPFIARWEGERLAAYRDLVGVPTICFGDTHGVRMGDRATREECLARLKEDVAAFYAEIGRCITNPAMPAGVQAAMLELAYNMGAGPVCRSTMMRLANAGQYHAACDELRRWVFAGGQRVRGLENRRADSKRALCLQGLI